MHCWCTLVKLWGKVITLPNTLLARRLAAAGRAAITGSLSTRTATRCPGSCWPGRRTLSHLQALEQGADGGPQTWWS